jgi:hypothetical protein
MSALECSITEQEGIRAAIPRQREVGDPCRVFDGGQRLLCPRREAIGGIPQAGSSIPAMH